jgi:phytoene dehydrogenase-like protein
MSEVHDAIVIGAGPEGLIAAAYLTASGLKTLVLEAGPAVGGAYAGTLALSDVKLAPVLDAFDPRVIKDLKLPRRGLKFAARDLVLVGLGARPLPLGRDVHAASRALAPLSARDAERYAPFRRSLFARARALRRIWWEDGTLTDAAQIEDLRLLASMSAETFLDATFESEAAKAVFAFDAMQAGSSAADAGTALLLAFRAAQEMCGLQGAVAVPKGGTASLMRVLAEAAAGAQIKTEARVSEILLSNGSVCGVKLMTGEEIAGRAVLSTLSRRTTLLTLLPTAATGFDAARDLGRRATLVGEGKLVLALGALLPGFAAAEAAARFILAERLEGCIAAHATARAGNLPDDFALEALVPTAFDSSLAPQGRHILSLRIRPLPVSPKEGWQALAPALAQKVLAALEKTAPGLTGSVAAQAFVPPASGADAPDPRRALASWRERIATPVTGLFLCGPAGEPFPALSGRAARFAAGMALAHVKGAAA